MKSRERVLTVCHNHWLVRHEKAARAATKNESNHRMKQAKQKMQFDKNLENQQDDIEAAI